METQQIFVMQFALSLVAWAVVAKWTFAPRLARMVPAIGLFQLALPHAFRHIGMVFVVPGVVAHELPDGFAAGAAYGDLATGVLALAAVLLLRAKRPGAIAAVWLFNLVGTVDLANALRHVDDVSGLGSVWYIPTMFVPLLLVTHFMMFVRLVRGASESGWYAEREICSVISQIGSLVLRREGKVIARVEGSLVVTRREKSGHHWAPARPSGAKPLFLPQSQRKCTGFEDPFGFALRWPATGGCASTTHSRGLAAATHSS